MNLERRRRLRHSYIPEFGRDNKLHKLIIEQIAQDNKETVAEVKRDMQASFDNNIDELKRVYLPMGKRFYNQVYRFFLLIGWTHPNHLMRRGRAVLNDQSDIMNSYDDLFEHYNIPIRATIVPTAWGEKLRLEITSADFRGAVYNEFQRSYLTGIKPCKKSRKTKRCFTAPCLRPQRRNPATNRCKRM